jgi:hypothetical protein
VFASHFTIPLNAACLDELRKWQEARMPDELVGSISILFDAQRLDQDVREATDRYMQQFAPRTRVSATIIHADGFAASAARAMAATFYLVHRIACPRKVFADTASAAAWAAEFFDDPTDMCRAGEWLEAVQREHGRGA